MKKHQKHAKLTRKNIGNFSHAELALVGHTCDTLNNFVDTVSSKISKDFKLAYIDASHSNELKPLNLNKFTFHKCSNTAINKNFVQNKYSNNIENNEFDLVFVNGNHYQAKKHIVFLNPNKENSIEKRINEIEDILFFIKTSDDVEVFESLKTKFSNYKEIPILNIVDLEQINYFIINFINENIAEVDGLILAGGKSTRMGTDKSQLEYYGKPHSEFLYDLFENNNLKVNYSLRENKTDLPNVIQDSFIGLGPFGAICSAFMHNPNKAYFVLATDLPFISNDLIKLILNQRDPSKIATTVKGISKDFPEPLITIWEPKSYQYLLKYLSLGISCPRKVLINEDVKIIEVEDEFITNVNTREAFLEVKAKLK